jgi:uncharacterized protein
MPDEQLSLTPNAQPQPGPVTGSARIHSIDVLRGFAVLGILAMNIYAFSMPEAAYFNPQIYGGFSGLNRYVWVFTHLFFDMKFMSIFSMLFGAGMVLMMGRAEEAGAKFKGFYFRRTFWLLIIGLVHAYLLWVGDILVSYAVTGFIIYLFRHKSAKALIRTGILLLLAGTILNILFGLFFDFMQQQSDEAARMLAAGEEPTEMQRGMHENWMAMQSYFNPSAQEIQEELDIYRDGYSGMLKDRAPDVLMTHIQSLPFYIIWRVGGLMLLGMGFLKLGVFSAERSRRFYLTWIILGYGLGLPIILYGYSILNSADFDVVYRFGQPYNYVGSVLVAMGHIGLVMLVCKANILTKFRNALGAVGRMALTNYLMHTIILTTIFYGYGLGLFGHVDRFAQMGFVLGMWILQLIYSPVWLRHFRFGPAEWLWRSLTYRKKQPMRN